MRLTRTTAGALAERDGAHYDLPGFDWDLLFRCPDPVALVADSLAKAAPSPAGATGGALAPIVSQEVWAAGVTYYRSRDARMEESKAGGGEDFYARVYEAERPELFMKATPHRVVGPEQAVRIRADSKWNVPEPELTLAINSRGAIFGVTVGNDMSSRDIEGENPLYLPQAKVYDGCCALGPCILLRSEPLPAATEIAIAIRRAGKTVFDGATTLAQLRRTPEELAGWLFRENLFPNGAFLMTGTGIVPASSFTLLPADRIEITIEPIGTLVNTVV
ncbi:MAG TPA: fumarylacetoacetate hydrolase family protein [Chthonomonadaceae bacterium]|nr:fumarylacetoacetate hydrolase family protein [Chthonomonadaceae bacterium]